MLTQEQLKRNLTYSPETGLFVRISNNRETSSRNGRGYMNIVISGDSYLAHRLAWLYIHGYWPENQIDHINRDKEDNRILNLREVSATCNQRNCGNSKNNKSGVKGVFWEKTTRRWRVMISINNKAIYVGNFTCFTEAVCHRLAAEQAENWSGCDSSSPAYQYVTKKINGER